MKVEINQATANNAIELLKSLGYSTSNLEKEDFKVSDEKKAIVEGVKQVSKKELETEFEAQKKELEKTIQNETYIIAAKKICKHFDLDYNDYKEHKTGQLEAIATAIEGKANNATKGSKEYEELQALYNQTKQSNATVNAEFEKYKKDFNEAKLKELESSISSKIIKEYAFNQILEKEVSEITKKAVPNSAFCDENYVRFMLQSTIYKNGHKIELEEGTNKVKALNILNEKGVSINKSDMDATPKSGLDIFTEIYGEKAFKKTEVEEPAAPKAALEAKAENGVINPFIGL